MPPPSPIRAAHSGFETQRRCQQQSNTGVSVNPQKGLMSSKFFFKKLHFAAYGAHRGVECHAPRDQPHRK